MCCPGRPAGRARSPRSRHQRCRPRPERGRFQQSSPARPRDRRNAEVNRERLPAVRKGHRQRILERGRADRDHVTRDFDFEVTEVIVGRSPPWPRALPSRGRSRARARCGCPVRSYLTTPARSACPGRGRVTSGRDARRIGRRQRFAAIVLCQFSQSLFGMRSAMGPPRDAMPDSAQGPSRRIRSPCGGRARIPLAAELRSWLRNRSEGPPGSPREWRREPRRVTRQRSEIAASGRHSIRTFCTHSVSGPAQFPHETHKESRLQ